MTRSQRSLIAKLRLGILPINIETGRYSGLPRDERFCPLCSNNEVESEAHVMLYCPLYDVPRANLFSHAQSICDRFDALSEISKIGFLTNHINMVRKTAHYISEMLKIREMLMNL